MDVFSLTFVLGTICSALIFYLIKAGYRAGFLVALSSLFIASLDLTLLVYVFVYSVINFTIGSYLSRNKARKWLFGLAIIFNLAQLIVLKYAAFAIDPLIEVFNGQFQVSILSEVIVPIGISYFTLQGIGYVINIKMGWEKPEKRFDHFFLYIVFFPKFVSGPIERSKHFLPILKCTNTFNEERFVSGLRLVLLGFFKKVAIANQLAPLISNAYGDMQNMDAYSLWFVVLLQPMYLYFDFSGYTDMAIGLSSLFGIDLLPNFKRPFFSTSMTNFWKRFHISLSSWFNDYIFKQTLFKRRKWGVNVSTIYAVVITWILFGIWHGAGWNFMLLGVLQAIAIIFEFYTKKWRIQLFGKLPKKLNIWISRFIVYIFYAISLVFFFSPDIFSTVQLFANLFVFSIPLGHVVLRVIQVTSISVFYFMLAILFVELLKEDYTNYYHKFRGFLYGNASSSGYLRWTIYSSAITMLFVLYNNAHSFIYSQF